MLNKIRSFTKGFSSSLSSPKRLNLNYDDLSVLGCLAQLQAIPESEAYSYGKEVGSTFILKNNILSYILDKQPDFQISESALSNIIKYSYLYNKELTIRRRKIFNLSDINEMLEKDVVILDIKDYLEGLSFSIKMYQKIQSKEKIRYGTFYDAVARRSGTVINYLERHMIGKLGEAAIIKLLNNEYSNMRQPYSLSMSYNTENPDAVDIVSMKNSKGLIVNTHKKVQIKASTGLKSCILKENESKLISNDFSVDYCVFSQVLIDPFAFFIDLIINMGSSIDTSFDGNLENSISDFFNSVQLKYEYLKVPVKIAGYIPVTEMTLAKPPKTIPPLTGPLTASSYYSHVKDLRTDFKSLADDLIPRGNLKTT